MHWHHKIRNLIGQPVGISLTNGQGTSGVLCGISGSNVLVIEYLYQAQFALKQYDASLIQDINGFPPCHSQQPLY
ncbi:hypothetical protein [Neobacillus jeddahensis]|uniref:hypothetical protein n=1 Tax=Neobacillus jeddahensis TaxID=1461580 RepID=UPI00058DA132|nr:hypothetical protein [Neobacillus jeddahensis]